MTLERETPKEVIANKSAREVIIRWEDGHESRYSFNLIRAACPCASCRGGHENMRSEPVPEMFTAELPVSPATTLRRMDPVGTYALSFEMEDGHHFGIYTWHYLRALCACPECREGK